MSGPQIKGWCPGALRPMLSGDGWLVRVRPGAGRLTQSQAAGIAMLATRHGNAVIDLTRRLLEAHAEVERLRSQLDGLERGELERVKAERDELAAYKARLTGSRAFKLAQRMRSLPGVSKVIGV